MYRTWMAQNPVSDSEEKLMTMAPDLILGAGIAQTTTAHHHGPRQPRVWAWTPRGPYPGVPEWEEGPLALWPWMNRISPLLQPSPPGRWRTLGPLWIPTPPTDSRAQVLPSNG
jgi:hypothetical protein